MTELVDILLILAKQGPAAISFATSTYAMFKSGTLTEEQLKALWVEAGNAAKAAEARWAAAG